MAEFLQHPSSEAWWACCSVDRPRGKQATGGGIWDLSCVASACSWCSWFAFP